MAVPIRPPTIMTGAYGKGPLWFAVVRAPAATTLSVAGCGLSEVVSTFVFPSSASLIIGHRHGMPLGCPCPQVHLL